MTFAKFQKIFADKYPEGRVWMHNEVCRDQSHYKQKVAVEFQPGGKLYFYAGAYEDVLCKVGINCISKERFAELEQRLEQWKRWNGTDDFFGGVMDYTKDIQKLTDEIENYKKNWIIA